MVSFATQLLLLSVFLLKIETEKSEKTLGCADYLFSAKMSIEKNNLNFLFFF